MEEKKYTPAEENAMSASSKDDILPTFRKGEKVRCIKEIRNDGTYAYAKVGEVLVAEGEEGFVKHIGDFLQTIRVYEVDFIRLGKIFGCREFEIESIDDEFAQDVDDELEWLRQHREKRAREKSEKEQSEK